MSGLFKRLSSRWSAGPELSEPQQADGPGAANVPASPPAEPDVRPSLLTDPAAPTRILREDEQPSSVTSGDPLAARPAEPEPTGGPARALDPRPAAVDPNAPAPFGPYGSQPAERNPFAPEPFGPQPAPYVAPVEPIADLPA